MVARRRKKMKVTVVREFVTMDDLRDLARQLSTHHRLDRETVELQVCSWYFLREAKK